MMYKTTYRHAGFGITGWIKSKIQHTRLGSILEQITPELPHTTFVTDLLASRNISRSIFTVSGPSPYTLASLAKTSLDTCTDSLLHCQRFFQNPRVPLNLVILNPHRVRCQDHVAFFGSIRLTAKSPTRIKSGVRNVVMIVITPIKGNR